jgi:hypothetical protein
MAEKAQIQEDPWESLTEGGLAFKIYEVYPNQYESHGAVLRAGRWYARSWTHEGICINADSRSNLIRRDLPQDHPAELPITKEGD